MIDYIVSNSDAFRELATCSISEHPLNTSDHLPVCCSLQLAHITDPTKPVFPLGSLDWIQAVKDGNIQEYSRITDDIARSFLQKEYSSIEDFNHDIVLSAKEIASAAVSCVPMKRVKSANSSSRHKDVTPMLEK